MTYRVENNHLVESGLGAVLRLISPACVSVSFDLGGEADLPTIEFMQRDEETDGEWFYELGRAIPFTVRAIDRLRQIKATPDDLKLILRYRPARATIDVVERIFPRLPGIEHVIWLSDFGENGVVLEAIEPFMERLCKALRMESKP